MDTELQITRIRYENDLKSYYLKYIAALETEIFHDAWNENVLCEMLENDVNYIYVAIIDNNVAGYYCMQLVAGESELLRIAVAPDVRRKGIGNLLMKNMEEECILQNCERIFLEVNEKNVGAFSLYEQNQYTVISKRKDYYGKGENALIMMKKL